MNTTNSACGEAYVINSNGTRTAVPIEFANENRAWTARARLNQPRGRFKLHLGRRIFGIVLTLIGIPMLILPGPGIACILAGLALTFSK